MFALSDEDLAKKVVGCGDGPASFNCTLSNRGGSVLSVDPLYLFAADDIARRIADTYDTVMEQTRQNRHEFVWQRIASEEELGLLRTNRRYASAAPWRGKKCACFFISS